MTAFESRSSELQAAVAAAIGSISVGFVPFFITGLHAAGVDTVSALFFRYLIALALLVPLAAWMHREGAGLVGEWRAGGRWLFINGLTLGPLQAFCYFKAVERLPTSVVITVFYCYPIFALVLDRLVHGLVSRWTTLAAMAVVISGVALTSLPGFAGGRLDPIGLLFAMLAPVSYAVYIAVAYPFTRRVAPMASAAFIYGAMATGFGLAALLAGGLSLPPQSNLWLNLLFMGTFGGALQILAFAFALPRLSSSGYALIVCLEVVTVVLAGVFLLGETIGRLQWVGISMVLVGILTERIMRARRPPVPASTPAPAKT